MSHTPGPWNVIDGAVFIANAVIVQHAAEFGEHVPTEERDANARLIAAAPELLEACQSIIAERHRQGWCDSLGILHKTEKAIAKATGQKATIR